MPESGDRQQSRSKSRLRSAESAREALGPSNPVPSSRSERDSSRAATNLDPTSGQPGREPEARKRRGFSGLFKPKPNLSATSASETRAELGVPNGPRRLGDRASTLAQPPHANQSASKLTTQSVEPARTRQGRSRLSVTDRVHSRDAQTQLSGPQTRFQTGQPTELQLPRERSREQPTALGRATLGRRQRRQPNLKPQPTVAADKGIADKVAADKVTPIRARTAQPSRKAPKRERPVAPSRRRSPGMSAILYAMRMAILSVGIGVLVGTLLSVRDPASLSLAGSSQQPVKQANASGINPTPTPLPALTQEISPLKSAVQTIVTQNAAQTPPLGPGVFLLDLENSAYVDINGSSPQAAASTIKIPVLVAFFQDVDAGKIRLDEMLTLKKELIGSGSGELQYQSPGTQFTALEVVTKMITISDNTATNLLIARMGGIGAMNQRVASWGLTATKINNLLPDLEGTNTTSAKDLGLLVARLSQGELVSMKSRDRLFDIMRHTVTDTLLPRGLGEGATIAHKTGDIGTSIGDIGLIDLPNGKRYAAAVLVKRSFNDPRAGELIRQISRAAYQHFSGAQAPQTATPSAQSQSAPEIAEGATVDPGSTAQLSNANGETVSW